MILVAVHATLGEQAEYVYGFACADGVIDCSGDGRIGEELAVTNGFGHAGEVLIHHAASAEVHVADLGIAHLPVWQADIHARTRDQAVGLSSP